MKKAKRALALALVFALVASFCVTGAAAAPGDGPDVVYGSYENGSWTQTPDGNGTYYDTNTGVTVSKTAVAGDNENEYEVTLQVQTTQSSTSTAAAAATVLVIDTSGSMNACAVCGNEGGWLDYYHAEGCRYYSDEVGDFNVVDYEESRMFAAKEAAKDFIDSYGDSTAARYVGIVSFDNSSSIEGTSGYGNRTYWFDASNDGEREAAKGLIDDLSANGGTDLAGGLSSANSMFTNQRYNGAVESITNRYAVVLTDGEPDSAWYAANSAESLRNTADVYTVCFGVADKQLSGGSSTTIGEFLSGSIATPASGDKVYAYDADDGEELQAAFADISTSITVGLTGEGLVVTDPMANGMTADVSSYGISAIGDSTADGFYWTLHNGTKSETTGSDGETITTYTYEKTYTVTVDPDAFEGQVAGYYPLNGETYLTIPGEHGQSTTVQFPVPGVYVTPTVSEPEQDVYVYVQVVDEYDNALGEAELAEVREWGLTELNNSGYFTIGMVEDCMLPPIPDDYDPDNNIYKEYGNAVDLGTDSLDRFEANENFDITGVTWDDLHVADGADDYVSSGTPCWHLDGKITLEQLEQRLVTVTYNANAAGATGTTEAQSVIKGFGVTLRENGFTNPGYTFTGWNTQADGNGTGYTAREQISALNENLTLYAQWSENVGNITIEVYVDGSETPVELTTENLNNYISNLEEAEGTPTFTHTVEGGVIKGTYNYEQFNSADIVLTPNSDYILQGIEGTFIQGSNAWQGITQSDDGDGWKIDNVMGESTLEVYLNTKYSVEYKVPEGFEAPTDSDVYVTGEGVTSDNSNQPVTGQDGEQRSWKNDGLNTSITIKPLPDGTTGWTDEANDSQTAGTEITVSTAVTNGLDDNSDHIFTFTATANEYTVTYHANTSADDPTLYTDSNTVTHGESYTVLGNTNDYFQYTNTGYTFAGWATSATGGVAYSAGSNITVTEDVDLYAVWTAITGTLTVTKTVEADKGTVTLPDAFTITVTGTSGAADGDSYTLTIGVSDDENKNIEYSYDEASGAYKWVISGAALGNYSVSESNTQVIGYKLDTSASTQSDTMTLTDTATSDSAALKNVYVKDNPGLDVVKTVYSVGDATGENIPEKVKVGDVIVYQIVVTNTGNVLLTNISVTDTLGESELMLYTDAACTTPATTFDLDVNGTKELYATYTVQAADAGTKLTNTATAEDEDGTEDSGEVTVNVTPQYKVEVVYHYDTVDGTTFTPPLGTQTVFIYDAGEDWDIGTVPEKVSNNGENYIFDESRSDDTSGTNISSSFTVNLVYVKDEWKDGDREDPKEEDDDEGGDGTPDYQQALILYEVAEGESSMGSVSPEIEVVTLTDVADGIYKGTVTAASTATANTGYVFDGWTGPGDYTSDEANLSHTFTAVGGEEYVYTASFKTGTTGAEVTKTLDSYTRGDAEPTDIPTDFKARVGDVLNYKITIENTGDIALDDVTVSDSLWDEGKVETALVGGTGTNVTSGSCKVDVASGSSVTITYSYTVQADDIGKTITNTATVDLPGGDDPKDDEEVTVDDYSVTITPADIVAYTGGDGYSAVVGADDEYINNSTSGLPEPGYHVVLSDAVVDWLNDNGVAAGDGLTDDAADLAGVLSFTYDDGTNERNWSLRYVGVYSYNASGNPSAYVYSIVTETAGAPSVSLKYFDDLNEDGEADDNEVITSDDIMMSANQVNHTYKMTIEGGDLDQSQVKAVLKAGGKSLTTDIDIGIGELTVLSTTNEETTNSIAGSAAGVDSGVITAVGNDSITYYVNESGVSFNDEDLVSRVQLLIDEVTNETSGEFETAMAEAAFNAISADLRNAEYEMCYMDLVDTENGNAKVTFSGGELSIYWPLPDGASASDSFYIVHFTELDREHAAVGTDVLDTTNKDVIAGEVVRIGGEYYVTFDVGSFSPFVLVYGDEGGGRPIIPVPDPDDGDDEEEEFVPKWLNIDDHYAYIIGYEDGTVRPQGNITRAEVATIFFRLLTDEVREEYWSTESGYSDVSSSDWYNNAISTLSNLGVITGYEDGTFRPNASISRAEFVTIATRFFDYAAEYEGTFSDVSYSSWYADFVQAAVDMGLVNGYENGTFRPNASITRAEAVAIVNRVLLRRPDADHLLPWSVMNTFSDNVLESAWYYEDIQEATNSHDYEWLKSGVEDWTEKLPERDWAALEREWSKAYDAPGGEVTA